MAETNDQNLFQRKHSSSIVQPLLTDFYQITMAYAYWKSKKINDVAVFDLFFRKNPFGGEFTVFAGLDECLKFLRNFAFSLSDVAYLKTILPASVEDEFYEFLLQLDTSHISVYAIKEGNVVFPKEPLMRLEGPLIVLQLIETTLLNLVNYASLLTTNAARYRLAAGNVLLFEFGLRRAQGPDGGLSASKYAYMGGFDGSSNVLAGKLFGIPIKGTHAHSFVTAYKELTELPFRVLAPKSGGSTQDFVEISSEYRSQVAQLCNIVESEVNKGEFVAFIAFALAFPDGFMGLVDTYDVLKSGLINFSAVALALIQLGYKPIGIRLDSGDLSYLSISARNLFKKVAERFNVPSFAKLVIMASNDISEETILSLNEQGHNIDTFGIGTHLVTCEKQPALGCVYKMVEVNGEARIKLSQDLEKISIPGKKNIYRLYGTNCGLVDIMQTAAEPAPQPGEQVLCRHPFVESKRAYVVPSKVEALLELWYEKGQLVKPLPTLEERREVIKNSLRSVRSDIKRSLNPTPYKVAVTNQLYRFLHDLWLANAPIGELY